MKTIFTSLILMLFVFNVHAQAKKIKYTTKPKTSANAAFIIGIWDLMQMPTGDGMGQDQRWVFTKNSFVVEGYPELKQKGMYKVIKEKEDTLILKLYQQEGDWGKEDKEQKIVIDKKNERLRIGWLEFSRKK